MSRRSLIVLVVVFLGACGAGIAAQQAEPLYGLHARIGIGIRGFTDMDIDTTNGRAYLATAEGVRIVDTVQRTVGPAQGGLKMTGEIEIAPDLGRLFAELDADRVGFIDLASFEVLHAVTVRSPGSLIYDTSTNNLFVFSARSSRVLVFDARSARQVAAIELPGWGGRAALWTPGHIFVTSPPREGLFVIDTAERRVTAWPLPDRIKFLLDESTLVADPAGRTLFASADGEIVALDAVTGAERGRAGIGIRGIARLVYDPVTDALLAMVNRVDKDRLMLFVYRLDANGLTAISEQVLPDEVTGRLLPTGHGFLSVGDNWGGPVPLPSRYADLTIWRARRLGGVDGSRARLPHFFPGAIFAGTPRN